MLKADVRPPSMFLDRTLQLIFKSSFQLTKAHPVLCNSDDPMEDIKYAGRMFASWWRQCLHKPELHSGRGGWGRDCTGCLRSCNSAVAQGRQHPCRSLSWGSRCQSRPQRTTCEPPGCTDSEPLSNRGTGPTDTGWSRVRSPATGMELIRSCHGAYTSRVNPSKS